MRSISKQNLRILVICILVLFINSNVSPRHIGLRSHWRNADKWKDSGISHYRFVIATYCFCGIGTLEPVLVEVKNNQVKYFRAMDGSTPKWLKQSDTSWMNIDYFFEMLAEPSTASSEDVIVTYDETYGYPKTIWIDGERRVYDDELYVAVSSLIQVM